MQNETVNKTYNHGVYGYIAFYDIWISADNRIKAR